MSHAAHAAAVRTVVGELNSLSCVGPLTEQRPDTVAVATAAMIAARNASKVPNFPHLFACREKHVSHGNLACGITKIFASCISFVSRFSESLLLLHQA